MTDKTSKAVPVADFIFDALNTMPKWGAALTVEQMTDRRIMVHFPDNTPSVVITVSEPKGEKIKISK